MTRKRILIISSFLIVPLLIFAVSVWVIYLKQKDLTRDALTKINEEFVGILTIEESYVSPFANFPYISIDLKNIRFFATKEMDDKPIYEAADFYLGFNIWDLLRGDYKVKKLTVNNGHLDLVRFENGDINLLMAKGMKEEEGESTELVFELAGVRLQSFDISFFDVTDQRDMHFHIADLKTDLRFSSAHIFVDLVSDLVFDLEQDGTPTFFSDKKIHLDLNLDYFTEDGLLKIAPSKAKLEEAMLSVSGQIAVLEKGLDMDLKFDGEKPDFNIFAAFLPKEVGEALKKYKNEGEVFFIGSVKGFAGEGESPAISVEFGADNAYFLNTGIQKKVDELRFSGFFTNGAERNLKTSEIQLQHFHARPEEGIFQGRMTIRNFEDPFIKINLNADLDLEFLGDFFEIEGLRGIQGQVVLDMDFDELIDLNLPPSSISRVEGSLQSELFLKNLSLNIPGYHLPVKQANAYAYMRRGKIVLDSLSFKIGSSDFAFSGELSDFSNILHASKEPLQVKLNAKSKFLDTGELMAIAAEDSAFKEEISDFEIKLAFSSSGYNLSTYKYLPKGEFFIEDFYAQLKHYPHRLHDFHADILIQDDHLIVKDFKGEIDQSDFLFTGRVDNYRKWFEQIKRGDSSFEFDLVSKKLQLHDLLSYKGVTYLPESYSHEVLSDLKLKGKVDLHYQDSLKSMDFYLTGLQGKMNLHPLKLEDFKGRVHYEDSYLTLDNLGGRMGASDLTLDMRYYMGSDKAMVSNKNYLNIKSKVLDLDALMGFQGLDTQTNHQDSFNIFHLPFSEMDFSVQIDRMNYHTFWLEQVKGQARTTTNHYIYLDTLGLNAAGGKLGIKGYFNGSDPEQIYFHSEMVADKLDLDKLLFKFENFGQDYLINENLHGLVSGKIKSKFLVYPDLTPIIDKSEATMDLTVYQGSLVNFAPLDAMSSYFADRNLKNVRFDTLSNVFDLKGGVLHIPKMNINSSLGFIELSGKQSLDMNMDYFIRVPLAMVTQVGFRALFGGKNKNEIDPDQEDGIVYRDQDKRIRFVNINMKGTPDDYKISLRKDRN